jgi:hypothetical protein
MLRIKLMFALALLLAAASVACTGEPGYRVAQIDGVTIVENLDDGAWAGRADAFRLVLEQTYGADEYPEEAVLGNGLVLRFAANRSGEVYVQDGQVGRLVKFRRDGSVAWTAGRPGPAPGEFHAVTGVELAPDEQTVIVSNFAGRLDYWSADGELVETVTMDPERGLPGALQGFAGEMAVFSQGLERRLGARVVIARPDDLLSSLTFDVDVAPEVESGFARQVPIAPYAGGIAAGSNASYELRFYTTEGELVRRVTRDVPYPVRPGYSRDDRGRGARHDFGSVGAPMALPGGYFMVIASWEAGVTDPDATAAERGLEMGWASAENWRMSFDLFDAEGRFLQSIVPQGPLEVLGPRAYPAELGWPRQTTGAAPGETPYLFTLAIDPFPQIRRYRIELTPPPGRR